ncbi:MAG: class I SAM-dependent methyltransferase [Actinomycetia bacterium]|nr:class I SAM-dependent methyltransferase [Actinomycetes bacterium]
MPNRTDQDWEWFGANDPYFSVVTQDRFHADQMTSASLAQFWQTGVEYMETVFATVRKQVRPDFSPRHSLDFGCGVGRLLFPLAELSEQATGVDVSAAMLAEARKQAQTRSLDNVTLVQTGDCATLPSNTYDFVHSFIVFQHMSQARGEANLTALLHRLRPNGVGALHFTYEKRRRGAVSRWNARIRQSGPGRLAFRGADQPTMLMTEYDLNALFRILHEQGITQVHTEATDHGTPGVTLFFVKPQ